MTESDLLSMHGWNSEQVRILGFRLGMTWPEVQEQARARHFGLIGEGVPGMEAPCAGQGSCQVCEGSGLCGGLALDFGTSREVAGMSITKIPEDAAKEVRKNALQRRFQGATRDFFEKYSKDLRLKLLGAESSKESAPPEDLIRSLAYRYREFGLVIEVSPCPDHPAESPCSDLELEFVPPGPAK